MREIEALLDPIRRLHDAIRDAVVASCENSAVEDMATVAAEEAEDTIYAVDRVSEEVLVNFFAEQIAPHAPVVLIAEGVEGGKLTLPLGTAEEDAVWRVIMDPIDGTRGLMYQKRSAWILTGVAPNRGPQTALSDITLAVQTEIPLVKQHLGDQVWAIRGQGVGAQRWDRIRQQASPLHLRPSRAPGLEHGFASVCRFFPGERELLGKIDDTLMRRVLGAPQPGKAQAFEDQYISTGGQLYEIMAGHDRLVADLRPLMQTLRAQKGEAPLLCSHPYDLCTALIAQEIGIVLTDERGAPLDGPLDVESDIGLVAYANNELRRLIEPHLLSVLKEAGLL
jgi:hypothetical protein